MDYLTTDSELASVANAIRTQGGTSENLSFPTGFVNAINALSDKLDANQGSENSGKFMKVGADGNLIPDTVPAPDLSSKLDKNFSETGYRVYYGTNGQFSNISIQDFVTILKTYW